jgi:hypothetical protein
MTTKVEAHPSSITVPKGWQLTLWISECRSCSKKSKHSETLWASVSGPGITELPRCKKCFVHGCLEREIKGVKNAMSTDA